VVLYPNRKKYIPVGKKENWKCCAVAIRADTHKTFPNAATNYKKLKKTKIESGSTYYDFSFFFVRALRVATKKNMCKFFNFTFFWQKKEKNNNILILFISFFIGKMCFNSNDLADFGRFWRLGIVRTKKKPVGWYARRHSKKRPYSENKSQGKKRNLKKYCVFRCASMRIPKKSRQKKNKQFIVFLRARTIKNSKSRGSMN